MAKSFRPMPKAAGRAGGGGGGTAVVTGAGESGGGMGVSMPAASRRWMKR